MDINVEAMLEAPFQEKSTEQGSSSHHRSSSQSSRHRDESRSSSSRRHHDRHSSSRHSSRHRSRSPTRSHHHRHGSPRRRSRSRHSSRRYRSRSPSYRRRSRSRDRSPKRRSRSVERRDRHRRRARSPSPPVPEEERDRRTIFVTQLAARLTSRELEDFFVQAGRVRDARIISDRNSRRSKGVGYVEFYDEESVQNALAMSGQKLLGIPVLVQMSEAEKNRYAMAQEQNRAGQELVFQRLYVGSIHFSLTEDDLRQIFEPFGPLDFVNLHKDPETGRSKGYAFIQYKNAADGKQALEKMNGFDLAGRQLKVGLVTERAAAANYGNLDDEDSAGLSLNSLARAELMHKLAARQSDMMEEEYRQAEESSTTPTAPARPNIPIKASRTIMLNNMFNPAEETEPDWVKDLETDVKEECTKFGQVEHIHVNEDSLGEVYLKFESVESAQNALEALDGRWFGGKQISAVFVPEAIYNAKFSL
ncbi:splicing factor cc1-like protein [Lichtheimia corymbifera JMRC:FSU:9682]|uniref:Splicing factor cc1-like protein n=1 Tax=Lichtheimia corymbifera JMRC:FSU:9682 TaxID=1263082 RepID=A0A068SEJ8_9FUNG|nr:splicing factor cc1-like protein [Lichtheimia corymbifera JMRC:FSU:9682]